MDDIQNLSKPFSNVFGYEDVKQELLLIKSWLSNEELLNDPRLTLPRGILFYGEPGCGKSLFVKELISLLDSPTYYLPSNTSDEFEKITDKIFEDAQKDNFSVIVIDEVDMLLDDRHIRRYLQTKMDGVEKTSKILFLGTTNFFRDIPEAFLRPGRFDKHISISAPDKKSRIELFKKYLSKLDINIPDVEIAHIANYAHCVTCADIMAICNDAYLRCGKNAKADDVELSYDRIHRRSFVPKDTPHKGDMRIAIHEAGHALMVLRFSKDFNLYKIKYTNLGGVTETFDVDEYEDSFCKRIESIKIGLSGLIAEQIVYGKHDIGSFSDLIKARNLADRLIQRSVYSSLSDFIVPYENNSDRYETPIKRARLERRAQRLINKCKRDVKRFLKSHKEELIDLANLLAKNGQVSSADIRNINYVNSPSQVGALIASYAHNVERPVA